MSAASDFLEDAFLEHVLNNVAYTSPAAIFLALSTADPLDTGAGLAEPVGNAYVRVAVVGNFTVVTGTATNTAAIEFPLATGSWGTITHFAILDASSGGNLLIHGALTASITVGLNEIVRLAVGQLSVSVA